MGAKYIPITAAKRIADDYGQSQVVVVTFDKATDTTHVVTYGGTLEECKQAAEGGNVVKKALGWPEEPVSVEAGTSEAGAGHENVEGVRYPVSWQRPLVRPREA